MAHTTLSKVNTPHKVKRVKGSKAQVKGQETVKIYYKFKSLGHRTGYIVYIESAITPGQRTGSTINITNIPGQKASQILSYDWKNQLQGTGDNTSI